MSLGVFSQAELIALRLLSERPTTFVMPDIVQRLLAKELVERRVGSLVVTSRGHAALLASDAKSPSDAA
jgi:hypothetical protein